MSRACPVELHDRRYPGSKNQLQMPRAGPVECSRLELHSCEREPPRRKAVASKNIISSVHSSKRETPRDKPVASFRRTTSAWHHFDARQARGIISNARQARGIFSQLMRTASLRTSSRGIVEIAKKGVTGRTTVTPLNGCYLALPKV